MPIFLLEHGGMGKLGIYQQSHKKSSIETDSDCGFPVA